MKWFNTRAIKRNNIKFFWFLPFQPLSIQVPIKNYHSLIHFILTTDAEEKKSGESSYEKLMHSLHHDPKWLQEVNLGRRVGLYKFRCKLGCGNFSQVKLAIHQLTKGTKFLFWVFISETLNFFGRKIFYVLLCYSHTFFFLTW